MRLLLIRHGQTPANVLGRLDTHKPGPRLTALGAQQAAAVPAALEAERIEGVFASTLIRTQLTAEPLAERLGLEVTVLDGLKEIEAGDLEDLTDAVSVEKYLSTALAWADGDLAPRIPGGHDGHEFFARFDAGVADIAATGVATVAVFTHGMAIRCWAAARCAGIDGTFAARNQLGNTGMVVLESTDAASWSMIEWHTAPIGGQSLRDATDVDPFAETLPDARRNAERPSSERV